MNTNTPPVETCDCPLVKERDQLAEWLSKIAPGAHVAVDFEAAGLHRYTDFICLAQLASDGRCAIVDPLASTDMLEPLGKMLTDSGHRKIFHGGDYDIRLLKKGPGIETVNVFDTMIAAQLVGREKLGLAALLEAHFGLLVDKRYQKADWSKRPLTGELLNYAAMDVIRLVELSEILEEELVKLGRLHWAEEEFRLLERIEPAPPAPPSCFNVKGSNKLAGKALAVLQALLELRDEMAREWDRPPFKVLSNHVLLEWAVSPPKTRKAVIDTRGAGKGLLSRLSERIMEDSARAAALPQAQWPQKPQSKNRRPPMTAEEKKLLSALKEGRNSVAKELGIDAGLLASGAVLESGVRDGVEALESLLKNWQKEAVGDKLLSILNN